MLRGLRTTTDMEYEFTMSLMNLNLDPEIETVFLMAKEEYSHVSSSLLRQIAVLGGDLSKFLPEPVRQAYYSDLVPSATRVLESAAWGWHSETAIHVLRMVLAGTLDKHPKLKLIIGHMGEMLPVMLARIDEVSALDADHLKRPISRQILDQV